MSKIIIKVLQDWAIRVYCVCCKAVYMCKKFQSGNLILSCSSKVALKKTSNLLVVSEWAFMIASQKFRLFKLLRTKPKIHCLTNFFNKSCFPNEEATWYMLQLALTCIVLRGALFRVTKFKICKQMIEQCKYVSSHFTAAFSYISLVIKVTNSYGQAGYQLEKQYG